MGIGITEKKIFSKLLKYFTKNISKKIFTRSIGGNYKTLMKEIKEGINNEEITDAHE